MSQSGKYTTEVFQDASLRTEFRILAQLRMERKIILKKVAEETEKDNDPFLSYSAITTSIYRGQTEIFQKRKLGEGLFFLSVSLARTLVHRYHLSAAQARNLVEEVASQYENEIRDSRSL
jgi:hypothetical protein